MKKEPDPQLSHVNHRRRMSWILLLAGLGFLISFAGSEFFGLPYWRIPFAHPYVAVLLASALALLGLRAWRCPRCEGHLGPLKARACTHCNVALTPEASREAIEPADLARAQEAFRRTGDSLARHKRVKPLEVLAGLAVVSGFLLTVKPPIFMALVAILLGVAFGVTVYQARYGLIQLYHWRYPLCLKHLPHGAATTYCPYCRAQLSDGEEA
jgi:hypothetical protein